MKKKILTIRTWVAASALLFSSFQATAQVTDSVKTKPLPEVVVTATRTEKNIEDVGRGITVISAADIQKSNYRNMGDLLTQQAGIYLVGAGQNTGMIQSIFLRGANSNQTAILVDGVRITDPSAISNALDLSELSLANIERIEIVRGSHSTLYGSSAIGGVVNIITKKNSQPGFKPVAEVRAGKFGKGTSLWEQTAGLNYGFANGFYVNAEANNQRIQGLDATTDTVTQAKIFNTRDQDNFKRLDLIGKAGFKNDKWDIYGSYKNMDLEADFDKREYIDDDNAFSTFNRHLFTYGATYKVSKAVQLKYIGGFSRMFRTTHDDSSAVDEAGTTDRTLVSSGNKGSMQTDELQANFIGRHITAVVGLGQYRETMNAKSYYFTRQFGGFESKSNLDTLNLEATTKNIFAHLDINGGLLSERLTNFSVAVGGRFNRHNKFGNYSTFEINPSYKIAAGTLLYGVIASGFNAPSLYQLYTPNTDFTSGITRGNDNLKPETSISYEIGVKQTLGNFKLGISYFQTEVKNTIDYVYLWTPNKPTSQLTFMDYRGDTYINLSRQVTRGLELDFNTALSSTVLVGGNISFVNGTLNSKPTDIETSKTAGNQVQLYSTGDFINKSIKIQGLARRPNTANINVTYLPIQKLALRLDARYAGTHADVFYDAARGPYGALGTKGLPDYTLVDLSANYKITTQISTALRLENALNNNYQEINGYTTRGRGVYVSLRYGL